MKNIEQKGELNTKALPFAKLAVMCRFFKRFTLWKIIGLSTALLAWAGDAFFGWQSNIGYYFLGAIASWCVSENGTNE